MALTRERSPLPEVFDEAFEKLSSSVSSEDARLFTSTTLEDVRLAAKTIEKDMELRGKLRGMGRIRPLLTGLQQYDDAIGTLCNGTPFLAWIWAPIKFMLQISQDHIVAYEKLIDAYALIGNAMPQFQKLTIAFKDDRAFLEIAGMFYADVLEFHRRVYKFFKRRAWKVWFEFSWKNFNIRFQIILDSLTKHRDLVYRAANTKHIVNFTNWKIEHLKWRIERQTETDKLERERRAYHIREAVSWLGGNPAQEDAFAKLLRAGEGPESDWIFQDRVIKMWLRKDCYNPVVWINGKPGAGKSVICAKLVEHCSNLNDTCVLYYFCSSHDISLPRSQDILQTFATQLLEDNKDLASYVLETFANQGRKPTVKHLKEIITRLTAARSSVRIVLDGIDEVHPHEYSSILEDVTCLADKVSGICKILISSRKLHVLAKQLFEKPTLSLEDNSEHVQQAIAAFAHARLTPLRKDFSAKLIDEVELKVLQKANGMFLWVRLVLSMFDALFSEGDINEALQTNPTELDSIYEKILQRVCGNGTSPSQRRAIRILQWVSVMRRPLRKYEIETAIIFDEENHAMNESNRIRGEVLALCGPLLDIEEGPGGSVDLIHFTAKEYLLRGSSPISQIKELQAHFTVSVACIYYLNGSFEILCEDDVEGSMKSKVLLGNHDLQLYANDFWVEHVSFILKDKNNVQLTESQNSLLKQALSTLVATHEEYFRSMKSMNLLDVKFTKARDPACSSSAIPDFKNFVQDLKSFRQATAQAAGKRTKAAAASYHDKDPTLFSKLKNCFQTIVETLLLETPREGNIDTVSMESFRQKHSMGAFLCSYSGCPNAFHGFHNRTLRDQHEESHMPKFRCTLSDCGFYGWPFKTKRALKNHENSYHPSENHALLPTSLRSTALAQTGPRSGSDYERSAMVDISFANLTLNDVPPSHKTEGDDWWAIFNPDVKREIDIEHLNTFDAGGSGSSIDFSPDGKYIATRSSVDARLFQLDPEARLWQLPHEPVKRGNRDQISPVRFSNDSKYLITGTLRHTIIVWNISTRRLNFILTGHERSIYAFAVAEKKNLIASGGDDCTARLWDLQKGDALKIFNHENPVCSVAFSVDDTLLASSTVAKSVNVWSINSGMLVAVLGGPHGHLDSVNDVVFAPNSYQLYSTSSDTTVRRWNLDFIAFSLHEKGYPSPQAPTTEPYRTFEGHSDVALCAAVSNCSQFLLSSSKDSHLHIWDTCTGKLLVKLRGHTDSVQKVITSPVNCVFATSSRDGTAKVWRYTKSRHINKDFDPAGDEQDQLSDHTDSLSSPLSTPLTRSPSPPQLSLMSTSLLSPLPSPSLSPQSLPSLPDSQQ